MSILALSVEPDEKPMVVLVSVIFFSVFTTIALGANAADTLFFSRFGVEFLPSMYMVLGVLALFALLGYTAGLAAIVRARFYPLVLITSAFFMVGLRGAISLDQRWVYAVIWLVVSVEIIVTFTLLWNVAGDVADARSGKRLFPLFASAGILGAVIGNLATGPLAGLIGVENLLVVVAAVLLLAAALTSRNAIRYGRVVGGGREAGTLEELRSGYRYAINSPLLRLLAVAMVLATVLFFAVVFPFSAAVAESFTTETEIASFLGLFSAVATAGTFLVSLFLAERLFRAIGVVGSVLLVAITYVLGFGLWLIAFGLAAASLVRFAQWVAVNAIQGTARTAIFNVVRSEHRGAVMGFMFAVPLQLGITVAGIFLWISERWLTSTQLFLAAFAFALVYTAVVAAMRPRYLQALVVALRSGVAGVFGVTDRAVASTAASAETIAVLREALSSERPETRRAALDIAASIDAAQLGGEVERCLGDPDFAVRVAALEAVLDLGFDWGGDVAAALAGHDGLSASMDAAPSAIRGRAAVVLWRSGREDLASGVVEDLLVSDDATARAAGVQAAAVTGAPPGAPALSEVAAGDPSPAVRATAVTVLGAADPAQPGALIRSLDDPSLQVRIAGARAARESDVPVDDLLAVVASGSLVAKEAALMGLSSRDGGVAKRIRPLVRPLLDAAARDRALALAAETLAVGAGSEAASMLSDELDRRSWARQRVVIRSLAGDSATADLIIGGLRSEDLDARAQALEALDSVGHDSMGRRLLRIAEGGLDESRHDEALAVLLQDEDEWIRALTVRSIEAVIRDRWMAATDLARDPSPVVRDTAGALLAIMEAHMAESLDLLGPVERVIALRNVPLFSSLRPEDLNRLADAATEHTYAAGTRLFSAGDTGSEMCVILEGTVDVTLTSGSRVELLNQYGPGDHVGELAVLRRAPRAADVTATSDLRVLAIDDGIVDSLLVERPEVARAMLASLADRLADENAHREVEERD
jgi:hypothetical protein